MDTKTVTKAFANMHVHVAYDMLVGQGPENIEEMARECYGNQLEWAREKLEAVWESDGVCKREPVGAGKDKLVRMGFGCAVMTGAGSLRLRV